MQLYENILSMVGMVSPLLPLPAQRELAADEHIGNWQVPYPMYAQWELIFRAFGLWHNSNGVCVDGVSVVAFSGSVRQFYTAKPLFVGDFLIAPNQTKRQVVAANNTYDARKNMWRVWVEYGHVPRPQQVPSQSFSYLVALYEAHKTQSLQTKALVSSLFEQVMALVRTSDGQPLMLEGARTVMQQLIEEYEHNLNQSLKELEDSQWRF